jgi:hypothetical protein
VIEMNLGAPRTDFARGVFLTSRRFLMPYRDQLSNLTAVFRISISAILDSHIKELTTSSKILPVSTVPFPCPFYY